MTESEPTDRSPVADETLRQFMRDLSRRHEIAVQRMLNESAERRAGIRADTQAVLRALDRFESQSG